MDAMNIVLGASLAFLLSGFCIASLLLIFYLAVAQSMKTRRKRLDPHRFDWCAVPRPARIRDETVLERARRRGFCEKCIVPCARCHPHHLKSRGSGGNDENDNIVALCPACHHKSHTGEISRDELRQIVDARYRTAAVPQG